MKPIRTKKRAGVKIQDKYVFLEIDEAKELLEGLKRELAKVKIVETDDGRCYVRVLKSRGLR